MSKSIDFKALLPHIAAVVIMLLVNVAYFSPQLEGKKIQQHDIVQAKAMSQEVNAYEKEHGYRPLWSNTMFGGMPTYQFGMKTNHNLLSPASRFLRLWIGLPIGLFFAGMLAFYLFMQFMKVGPWTSLIASLAFGLNTNNMVLWGAGHTSKVHAIFYFALIFAGIVLLFRKRWLLGGALFALGLGLDIMANHVQMTYYLFLVLVPYFIVELVSAIKQNDIANYGKAIGIMVLAGLLAVGSSASRLWTTYEYAQDTMRGKPILEVAADKTVTSSSETDGLDWTYAMNWSGGLIDCIATYIPGAAGGSSTHTISPQSEIAKDFRKKGANVSSVPMYWGGQPSTAGPVYLGAIAWFLFILGMFVVKGTWKWGILASVIFAFLLSLGKYFSGFNEMIFNLLPLYNKFRSPFSIHGVTSFLIPAFGFYGLSRLFKTQNTGNDVKDLIKAVGVAGGLALILGFAGSALFGFEGDMDQRLAANGWNLDALYDDRVSMMRNSALTVLGLVLIAGGLLFAYLKGKISQTIVLVGIGILTVGDLWMVGKEYLGSDNWVTASKYDSNFNPRAVDKKIGSDTDPNYRVLDLTVGDPFQYALTSYHHKSLGGYHAAKLQRFEDIKIRHLQPEISRMSSILGAIRGNPTDSVLRAQFSKLPVMNMMNTKYFILGSPGTELDLRNPAAYGNAWFVNAIKEVPNANEEIAALSNTDLRNTAVVHQEFSNKLSKSYGTAGSINLSSYQPDKLTYSVNSSADGLAVFSEMWYGPKKGWKAYIDGQAVDHIRANYALRALEIPAGEHTVEFMFEPTSYHTGKLISMASSGLILALLAFLLFKAFQSGNLFPQIEEELAPVRVKKTKSKKSKKNKK